MNYKKRRVYQELNFIGFIRLSIAFSLIFCSILFAFVVSAETKSFNEFIVTLWKFGTIDIVSILAILILDYFFE